MSTCIFCLRDAVTAEPFCKDNPGHGCTYGFHHEGVEGLVEKPKPAPKGPDKKLCLKCGLHPKNPAASTNGCAHEYAAVS